MTNATNTRELALDILIEVNEKNQYSHLVLRSVLDKYQYLEKQERAFLTRVTEGTIEHMLEMDYIINSFSKVKTRKMKPLIRNLLRMSVYQIRYMDAIPDSAVCNEAVKLAKKRGFRQLSGFVNGVLRTVAREADRLLYPDPKIEPVKYLEVTYSTPQWIVEKWMKDYGFEKTEEILKNFYTEKPLTIRTNPLKCTPQELWELLTDSQLSVEKLPEFTEPGGKDSHIWQEAYSRLQKYAYAISDYDYLHGIDAFEKGMFYVQDISSMMVAEMAEPKENDYVIDVCAAPGGKSSHIAELLQNSGMVEARDLTEYKVEMIEDNIVRHGLSNMKAVCMDATVFDQASVEKADILICDLPCSGLGVMGKKTDIRYKMTEEKQKELVKLQRQMLKTVHSYVKKGGTLIYSTCTINKEENEENAKWIAKEFPELSLVTMKQMFPGEQSADGFFIAKYKRSMEA